MRASAPSLSSSRSPASAMSHFASNLASLARSKLHSALSSGSRDNLSLHRWVLLKNSIMSDDSLSHISTETEEPDVGAPSLVPDAEDDDEDELLLNLDGDLFHFLFPDPGHGGAQAPADAEAMVSEAQWFDSLLETLGDEEEDDQHQHHLHHHIASAPESGKRLRSSALSPPPHSDPVSPLSSYSDDEYNLALPPSPGPIAVPYPVPYPPLVKPYGVAAVHDDASADDDHPYYYSPRARSGAAAAPYFLPYDDLEDSYLSMPDAVEDTSSDADSEMLPLTPFCGSRSSFSLGESNSGAIVVAVDPASVPLPRDDLRGVVRARGRTSLGTDLEPRIYGSPDDVFPFDPNPDMASDSPVYSPFFYQNC